MSNISATSMQSMPVSAPPPTRRAPVDADGDHDGTREASEASAPKAPKATATLGNKVNTFA